MTGPVITRRDLGRRLAVVRKAAGYTQAQLGAAAGYSRSTVSNAEIGHPDVARVFWARCDQILKTGRALTRAFDQISAAERREAAGLPDVVPDAALGAFRQARQKITSDGMAEALAGYRDLGWAAQPGEAGMELVTGDVLDALELPRAAGMLAVSLWLHSQGRADEILRVAALPQPARSLTVITAEDRCYFLAAPGSCPWAGHEPALALAPGAGGVIRWHAGGGRIPVPPSRLPCGERAAWARLPSRPVRLAPPVALLGLLATAAATAGHGPAGLTLPGGICVIPAPRPPGSPPASPHAAPPGIPGQCSVRPGFPGAGHHRESRATIDPRSGHAIH